VLLRPLTPSRIRAHPTGSRRARRQHRRCRRHRRCIGSGTVFSGSRKRKCIVAHRVVCRRYPDRRRGRNGGRAPDRTRTATDIAGLLLQVSALRSLPGFLVAFARGPARHLPIGQKLFGKLILSNLLVLVMCIFWKLV
jgi:hypothetical protein